MAGDETSDETGLRRDIGFTGSALLTFNGIVGAGIFALPGALHLQFGAFSPWLFPIFGVLVLIFALPFARLASLVPATGGPVVYAASFGPLVAFQVGWIYYLARVTSLAANVNVFAAYAAVFLPSLGVTAGRMATATVLIAAVAWINIAGVRRAIGALDAFSLLKALPLFALAFWGLAVAGGAPAPGPVPALSEVEAAALLILYAFIGFENSVVAAGETRDSRRTVPRALIRTIAATAALYFLLQLAYVAVMPAGADPDAPLSAFADRLAGPEGALVITAVAMLSIAGNLVGNLMATPRVTFAMAEQGMLPGWFGRVSARFATPANSILFLAVTAILLAASGTFVWLAIVSTLARMIIYGVSVAALPAVRRRLGMASGAGTVALVGAGLAVCVCAALQSEWEAWAMLAALLLAGFALRTMAKRAGGLAA